MSLCAVYKGGKFPDFPDFPTQANFRGTFASALVGRVRGEIFVNAD